MSGTTASTNTSATGGFLLDRPPGPPRAEEIERVLQITVQTLSNLPASLVRPRWQPMPPTQPPANVTWASVGVQKIEADEFPDIQHLDIVLPGARGRGADHMKRHMTVTVLVTMYGPEAEDAAAQLRDNLYIPQQMEGTFPLKLLTIRDLARAPELINQQWINRVDLEIDFRMQSDRIYPVLNLRGADVQLHSESGEAPAIVHVRDPNLEILR
jgi:hypothetical protein